MSRDQESQRRSPRTAISDPVAAAKKQHSRTRGDGIGEQRRGRHSDKDDDSEQSFVPSVAVDVNEISLTETPETVLQPKLRIGRSDDRYEVEADRVADEILKSENDEPRKLMLTRAAGHTGTTSGAPTDAPIQAPPSIDGGTQPAMPGTVGLQMQPTTSFQEIEQALEAREYSGSPLPENVLSFFEPRLGADLRNVRIHTDNHANTLTQQLNAEAFAYGRHIYFGSGRFAPAASSGRHLLAHELAHTVQQSAAEQSLRRKPKKNGKPAGGGMDEPLVQKSIDLVAGDAENPDHFLVTAIAQIFGLGSRGEAQQLIAMWHIHWSDPSYKGPAKGAKSEIVAFPERWVSEKKKEVQKLKSQPGGIKEASQTTQLREEFDKLRPEIRRLLAGFPATASADYRKVLTIAHKLERLPKDFVEKFPTFATGVTADINEFDRLVDRLLKMTPDQLRRIREGSGTAAAVNGPGTGGGYAPVPDHGIVQADDGTRLRPAPDDESGPVLPVNTIVHIVHNVDGWYVVALDDGHVGYVAGFNINTEMPEPKAQLYRVQAGDTGLSIAEKFYGEQAKKPDTTDEKENQEKVIDWGHDYRYFINVILYLNKRAGRNGIDGNDWSSSNPKAGEQIWIPSIEYAMSMRAKIPSGSFSYEIYSAIMDATVGQVVFAAGVIHGALESLWDLVAGLVELIGMLWKIGVKLINGTLLSSISALIDQVKKIDLQQLIEMGLEELDKKWNNPDFFARWHYRGWLIGYIAMEIITTFFTGAISEAIKGAATAGKFEKLIAKIPALAKMVDAVKALEKTEEAAKIIERLEQAGKVLNAARTWAMETLKIPLEIVKNMTVEAIERLKKLPAWIMERFSQLHPDAMRRVLGCASPCRVDLEEIIRYFAKTAEAGAEAGKRLTSNVEVLAALPAEFNPSKISANLTPGSPLLKAITEAGFTDLDFAKLADFVVPGKRLSEIDSYNYFTKYLSYSLPAKVGPDVKKFNQVVADMLKVGEGVEQGTAKTRYLRQAAAIKGHMFEAFAKMYIEELRDAVKGVRLKVPPGGTKGFRRPDLLVKELGEEALLDKATGHVWEVKHQFSAVPEDQWRDYAQIVGTVTEDGIEIKSINYLFPTKEAAETNALLNKYGINVFFAETVDGGIIAKPLIP